MALTTLLNVAMLNELLRESAVTDASAPRGHLVILDCRFDLAKPDAGRRAFADAHIPGARHADLNRDLSAPVTADTGRHPLPEPAALQRFFAAQGIGDDTQVVVYDEANGSFAARAWWLLRWLGHANVAVLDGGFKAWTAGGGAVQSGDSAAAAVSAGRFTLRPHPEFVVSADEVQAALSERRRLLVDARAPERFAGSVEPLDAVAGHVPGAVNHPFAGNLGADGRFLAPEELRRRWLERLGTAPAHEAILMCGSGVTACHNLLAMEVAGLPGGKLYAGSWSEWIRDPKRPVARG